MKGEGRGAPASSPDTRHSTPNPQLTMNQTLTIVQQPPPVPASETVTVAMDLHFPEFRAIAARRDEPLRLASQNSSSASYAAIPHLSIPVFHHSTTPPLQH